MRHPFYTDIGTSPILPEIVAELPDEVEVERAEFAPLNPRGTRLIFKPKIISSNGE